MGNIKFSGEIMSFLLEY